MQTNIFAKYTHLEKKSFVVGVVSLQSLCVASILLDLPIVRQVSGFLYLTLVPGVTLMRALKLRELTIVEHVSISVGLSISFIMLLGYLVNELGFLLGMQNPLSLTPLLFPLSMFVLITCAYIYLTEEKAESENHLISSIESKKAFSVAMVFIGLPVISLVGSFLSTQFSNNTILLFLTIGISSVFLLAVISARIVPAQLYPLALFAIAVSLLLQTTMVSQFINGYDLHTEFYCFVLTKTNSFWTPSIFGTQTPGIVGIQSYSGMLSLTILPVFFSVILNLNGELIFKVIYPVIFSIVPVVLFYVYREFFEEKRAAALLAVFFFMSYATFYIQMAYLARQMIAELFFVLILLIYAKNGFRIGNRAQVFVLFMLFFGIVVSHYAMTYFLIFYVLLFLLAGSTKIHTRMQGITHLLLLLTLAFAWYIFASSPASFNDLTSSLNRMIMGLSDIFSGRDPFVLKALGIVSLPSMWREIGRYTFYAVELLVIAGFLKLLSNRKRVQSNQLLFPGALASMLLLAFSIVIPTFSQTLNMTRIFQIALFFLAPLFVLGGEMLFGLIFRILVRVHKGLSWGRVQRALLPSVALLTVFFFLFQSGFIFALVGDIPVSPSLTTDTNKAAFRNLSLYDSYTFSQEVYGARWMLADVSSKSTIYADAISHIHVLRSYGLVSDDRIRLLTEELIKVEGNAYIYLRPLNTIDHIIENETQIWIIPENSSVLGNANRVYSNGGCEIFKGT